MRASSPTARCISIVGSLAASLASADARATPDFPGVVQQFAGAPSPPPCTICHNNPNGGLGTVTTAFGSYLRSRGLVAFDENSLRTALEADQGEQHVSNSAGVPDIQALREGLDPNNPTGAAGAAPSGLPPPEYGCGASVAGKPPHTMPALLVAALALIGVGLRRDGRRGPHGRPLRSLGPGAG